MHLSKTELKKVDRLFSENKIDAGAPQMDAADDIVNKMVDVNQRAQDMAQAGRDQQQDRQNVDKAVADANKGADRDADKNDDRDGGGDRDGRRLGVAYEAVMCSDGKHSVDVLLRGRAEGLVSRR